VPDQSDFNRSLDYLSPNARIAEKDEQDRMWKEAVIAFYS
jgi:hypothetical protein